MVDAQLELQRLWLSHHDDDDLERCVELAGRHVCRRCIVMYPIAFAVMGLTFLGAAIPTWLMFVLPMPVAVEFIAEHLGLRYSPQRQVVTTALAAPALGLGFWRVVQHVADGPFWTMCALFALPCLFVALFHAWSDQRATLSGRLGGPGRVHMVSYSDIDDDHPLLKGFASAEEFQRYLDAAKAEDAAYGEFESGERLSSAHTFVTYAPVQD